MSYLATALTAALDELGRKQHQFAESAGITRVQTNRACRGTVTVGRELIGKIVRALPEPHNARVLAAWLRDEAPDDLRDLIALTPVGAGSIVAEAPRGYGTELDARRADLLAWVRRQIIGTEFCDMLEALRAAIDAR